MVLECEALMSRSMAEVVDPTVPVANAQVLSLLQGYNLTGYINGETP